MLVTEKERCVLGKIHLPVGPTVPTAGLVPDVFHILVRKQFVHAFDAVVPGIFRSAPDPQNFEFLIQHYRIGFLPFGAVAAETERCDIRKLIEIVQPDRHRLPRAHRESSDGAMVAVGQHTILEYNAISTPLLIAWDFFVNSKHLRPWELWS
jgi:hypothetical protein